MCQGSRRRRWRSCGGGWSVPGNNELRVQDKRTGKGKVREAIRRQLTLSLFFVVDEWKIYYNYIKILKESYTQVVL